MSALRKVLFSLVLVGTAAPAASAQVINFDDLGASCFVPTTYLGMSWGGSAGSSSWVVSGPGAACNSPQFSYAIHSGNRHVWSNGGASLFLSDGAPFDFTSAWMAGHNGACGGTGTAPGASVHQGVRGSLLGTTIFDVTIDLGCHESKKYAFNFVGIDRIDFDVPDEGVINLLMDDLELTAATEVVPEPATVVLMATGLLGVAGLVRRRRNR